MSQRIEQTLEVIEEVRARYESVRRVRIGAVASVAERRGIRKRTVLDKFIRQLRPEVGVAADFDKLLEDYLIRDSDELRTILLKHIVDSGDAELVNSAL